RLAPRGRRRAIRGSSKPGPATSLSHIISRPEAMIDLKPYRSRTKRLADYLLWAGLVAPGVILNKDGAFQRTFEFRGPDLDSAAPAELMGVAQRLNNALRRFGSGWCLHVEARRAPAPGYP